MVIPLTQEMRRCDELCLDCYRICAETAAYAVQSGGTVAEPALVRLLLDCADACQLAAGFLSRGSELHAITCAMCAEICERCAEACERHASDPQMKACAEACRRCAASCRAMAAPLASQASYGSAHRGTGSHSSAGS